MLSSRQCPWLVTLHFAVLALDLEERLTIALFLVSEAGFSYLKVKLDYVSELQTPHCLHIC